MIARGISAFGPAGHFYECPRWRDGRWWVSDMRGGRVYSFSPEGEARTELVIDDRPAGLGWTPDGRLLVVSMEAKRLLTVAPGGDEQAVDLAPLFGDTQGFLNDLAVSRTGHIFVGMDADFHAYGPDADLGRIAHLPPQGAARVAAEGLAFPNGMVFTPDGATLVVAETMKPRLTAFSVERTAPWANAGSGARWNRGPTFARCAIPRSTGEPALTAAAWTPKAMCGPPT